MSKSPDAFRTISEVAEWLGVQAHVLRFWESKFTQVKPIKRAGGRRYYRPNDMLLLGGIKQLLHEDGLTIKGVQKILREEGMSHVASLSPPLDEATLSQVGEAVDTAPAPMVEDAAEERGVVLNFEAADPSEKTKEVVQPVVSEPEKTDDGVDANMPAGTVEVEPQAPETVTAAPEAVTAPEAPEAPEYAEFAAPEPAETPAAEATDDALQTAETAVEDAAPQPEDQAPEPPADAPPVNEPAAPADAAPTPSEAETAPSESAAALPAFLRKPLEDDAPKVAADNMPPPEQPDVSPAPETKSVEPDAGSAAPAPDGAADDRQSAAQAAEPDTAAEPEPEPEPAPKARRIDLAPFRAESDFDATPGALAASYQLRSIDRETAADLAPLLDRLAKLRDSMAQGRRASGSKD